MKNTRPVIAGLDIGSTKVSVVIGAPNAEGVIEVIGLGTCPNNGIRQGVVVNIEATAEAVRRARDEAELMSGHRISEVWVGVSGTHIKSFDSTGMVAIKNKEVSANDVNRVIEAAKAVVVPTDRTVLHVIPREYKVDGQAGILDPVGMNGIRLEANVHIVTGGSTAIANNLKCIDKAGLKVAGMVLDPLAASMAVLSEDEKNLGVFVVDMGGGSCNLVYFVNGSVAYTSVVPIGGAHFTHDVAVGLRTPQLAAEELKKRFGCAMSSLVSEDEIMEVEGVGGRKARMVPRREIAEVLEPRAEETLQLIYHDLRHSGLSGMMGSGMILTGGGSQLEGLLEMGEFIFDLPVRRGVPGKVGGLADVIKSASHATAVGLLLYGWEQTKHLYQMSPGDEASVSPLMKSQFTTKIKDFFSGLF